MLLSDVSIKRPVFATMMMLALITLGLFSFSRLAIEQWPNIEFPFILVQVVYPGASPETIERDLTRPIEEAVNPIQGVRTLTSSSLEGLTTVFIEFELGTNPLDAQQDVRAKIDQIREELPKDIEAPLVLRFDPQEIPIVSLALRSENHSLRELTTLADETIRRDLESIDGVGQVSTIGAEERAIAVELKPELLAARAVTVNQIAATLQGGNLEVPAGRLELGPAEQLVRVAARIIDPKDFAKLVVDVRNGVPIRISDLATVNDDAIEPRSAALVNGVPAIGLDLRKVSGANTVQVAESIIKRAKELQARLPEGVDLSVVRDDSIWIRQSVDDVETTILLGALLTVLVVFTFLNSWRSTVITGLTLPVSVIAAFLAIYAFGFTLNMMTLMGLSLATGILIDDAIVVRENIVRHVGMKKGHYRAAKEGTTEIGLAVLSTTLATLCVFIPVAFMGGIVGQFFREFGLTVACAVAVSLFVSFTLDPMLSSVWYDPVAEGHAARGPIGRVLERFNGGFVRLGKRYRRIVGWALGHRGLTMAIAGGAFIAALVLFPLIGGSFMPTSDEEQLAVLVKAPVGSTLTYTTDRVREVSALLRRHPEVAWTYETIGGGYTAAVNEAEIYVKMTPKNKRHISQQNFGKLLRSELEGLPGMTISVLDAGGFGGGEKPLQFYVRGEQLDELRRISDDVLEIVRRTPGAIEAESGLEEERPEVRINVNRDLASDLGINPGSISGTLRAALAGQTVSQWEDPGGEQHDVIIRLPRVERSSVAQLDALPIPTGSFDPETGAPRIVRLSHVADVQLSESPQEIDRRDMKRVVPVECNFSGRAMTAVTGDIMRAVNQLSLPAGYTVTVGGESEIFTESVRYILESLILAVIFIYLVLASQFGSFIQPLAIMLSLPLAIVGVLISLLLTGSDFNIISMIGLILLSGLVTKNAILLIEFANQRRRAGSDRASALIDAGEIRLRPIVMTTLAMIFGMLPLALALGAGAEFRAPMARAVIGGLITSSILTLVVVPVFYTLLDDVGAKVRERLTRREREFKGTVATEKGAA